MAVDVHFSAELRSHTGGVARVEVEAGSVRRLLRSLDLQFPGIAERLSEGTAVAIDGVIVSDALYEDLPEACEVHFLPALAGG